MGLAGTPTLPTSVCAVWVFWYILLSEASEFSDLLPWLVLTSPGWLGSTLEVNFPNFHVPIELPSSAGFLALLEQAEDMKAMGYWHLGSIFVLFLFFFAGVTIAFSGHCWQFVFLGQLLSFSEFSLLEWDLVLWGVCGAFLPVVHRHCSTRSTGAGCWLGKQW